MAVRRVRLVVLLLPAAVLLAAAASPIPEPSAEELIRRANALFTHDRDEANRLYEAAEVLTSDPGLVAFNRAAVLFQNDRFGEAATYYYRVLRDAACPPERAAKAWYNLGTCLINQPNATSAVYDNAITYLRHCLDSDVADAPLKANAAYNLKLAKLLWKKAWDEEERNGKKPPMPNDPHPPEEDPRNDPGQRPLGADPQLGDPDHGEGTGGTSVPKGVPQPATGAGMKASPANGQAPAPGPTGQLPPLEDRKEIQPLTPEQTREQLRQTAERLKRDQQILRMTLYGQERTGLHDW
jgi:tetratricopeptide (TPR) repeat protein